MEQPASENPYAAPQVGGEPIAPLPDLTSSARWARAALFAQVPLTVLQLSVVARFADRDVLLRRTAPSSPPASVFVLNALAIVVLLATVVTFLRWIYRAYCHAEPRAADLRYSPTASVVWWFIPLFNLWMPFLVVRHLWRVALGGAAWRESTEPVRVYAWWGLLILMLSTAGSPGNSRVVLGDASAWFGWLLLAGYRIGAALLAARIVLDTTEMLSRRAKAAA